MSLKTRFKKPPENIVRPLTLPDGDVRRAAVEIEKRVGTRRHDNRLTEADLNAADAWIHEPIEDRKRSWMDRLTGVPENPFHNINEFSEELIRDNLPAIRALLEPENNDGRESFFANAFAVQAVRDPTLRDAAHVVAAHGLKDTSSLELNNKLQVNKSDLTKALELVKKGELPAPPDGMTPERLAEVFTPENIRTLQTFMMTGEDNLIALRNVKIDQETFEYAFPMFDFKLPDANAVLTRDDEARLQEKLTQFDERFRNSGFDRIYVRGPENDLYVIPHKGVLKAQKGMRMQPGYEARGWRDTGQVLATFNAKNSLDEATFVMWGNSADGITRMSERLFKSEPKLDTLWSKSDAEPSATLPALVSENLLTSPAGMGAIGASLAIGAGVIVDASTTGIVAAMVAGLVQVTSLASATRNMRRKELNVFFHAAGVSVNREVKLD